MSALVSNGLNSLSHLSPALAGRVAFRLFTRPVRRASVRPDEQPVLAAATVDGVDLDGQRVRTYHWGDGQRTVLFVHGFEARAASFAGFVPPLLDAGLSVLAYDAPGHGDSAGTGVTILDHRRIIERLHGQHGPFHSIVAHSFGGLCAYYAVRGGVKTGRLVTIGAMSDFDALRLAFCERLSLRPVISRQLQLRTERLFAPLTDVWRLFSPVHRPEEITVPLLVMHDSADREIAVEHAHRLAAAYPAARLVITEGLGHRRILRDQTVVSTVLDFLTSRGNRDTPE